MTKPTEKLHYKVNELMQATVMVTTRSQTVEHARKVMHEHHVNCLPVAGPEGEVVGILTSTDLLDGKSDGRKVSDVMTRTVQTVPLYADASLAARTMRKHHLHHLVVVDEKKIVGVLSTFDLLEILEDKHSTRKNDRVAKKPRRLSGGRRETDVHGHTGD